MISINATLVLQVINFLVLIWILNRILFKPILKIMEEREKHIASIQTQMNRLRTESEEKAAEIEHQMRQARKKAAAHRDELRDQAAAQAHDLIQRAGAEARDHIHQVQTEMNNQMAEARKSLAEFNESIIEMLFNKIMGRKI